MKNIIENLKNAFYGVFITDKNARYEEYQEDSRRKYEAYIDFLVKENAELKKKLVLMRHYIYGNFDLAYKEMQLKHIDELGEEIK